MFNHESYTRKHRRFLIGGTGNQLLQIATAPSPSSFSYLINTIFFQRIFGWSVFPNFLGIGFSLSDFLTVVLILQDFIWGKLFGKAIFTTFDTNSLECPSIFNRLSIGYFNKGINFENYDLMRSMFDNALKSNEGKSINGYDIVCHFRGGDALDEKVREIFGQLDKEYYQKAIQSLNQVSQCKKILFLTDDKKSCETALRGFPYSYDIKKASLTDTVKTILVSNYFISSNSTLSLGLVMARNYKKTVIPEPYQKGGIKEEIPCQLKIKCYVK